MIAARRFGDEHPSRLGRTSPVVDRAWFARDADVVAPDLLNKILVVDVDGMLCSGRIIEIEAYLSDDPASHTFVGKTPRNAVMFGPPGHLYVYLSYGIHQCANIVTGSAGVGQGVLLRAVTPVSGLDEMRTRRGRRDAELANGPGKLCQALGIGAVHNGVDVLCDGPVTILDDGMGRPREVRVGPRVGLTKGVDAPLRFRTS